ncbi:paraquat-inducible protein A [Paraburkholderia acidiphila]|uniref:PqiA/YebS family transporter subunit n=1 Tax=Paraburkholderia acidiphila TaxID=2571747 RepID=A0A7Z2JAW1_9BURK|nr:paraquat-inducible protein A [Paraburkholderia acidiphila]QGZ58342.1 PqiA/YebS family transporter subunit [Paraburkholderia acidiphila]
MKRAELLVCHDCDLMQRGAPCPPRGTLRCLRCNAELERDLPESLGRSLAFALGALVLFVISNLYPIVGLAVNGNLVLTTLWHSVEILYLDGMWPIAALVFATTILMPGMQVACLLALLVPLALNRAPWRAPLLFRVLYTARPWGMTEVLILGLLVALVKLSHIATVVTGVALWSFGALMLVLAGASAAFDARQFWARVARASRPGNVANAPNAANAANAASAPNVRTHFASGDEAGARGGRAAGALTGAACGIARCHACGMLARMPAAAHAATCPRCGSALHMRKVASLSRTWALLVAAMVLYVPANVLPVMDTSSLFGTQKDTIMSGVVYLWVSGSWPLALLVFIASVAVPMLKILGLSYLAWSTQRSWTWLPEQRTRIYRLIELVGRWSMLDIYVITMLVALVQFNALATIKAGPAAIAFGAVVILTMFAANMFDPRLIWDAVERENGSAG